MVKNKNIIKWNRTKSNSLTQPPPSPPTGGGGELTAKNEYNLERISEPSRRREQSKASIHTNCLADSNLKIG